MCSGNVNKNRKLKTYKKHFLFAKAEEKFMQELDVVRISKDFKKVQNACSGQC